MKKEIHYYIFEDDDFKEILSQELDHISKEISDDTVLINKCIWIEKDYKDVFHYLENLIKLTIKQMRLLKFPYSHKYDFTYLDNNNSYIDLAKNYIHYCDVKTIVEFIGSFMIKMLQSPKLIKSNKRFLYVFFLMFLKTLGYEFKEKYSLDSIINFIYFYISLSNVETDIILSKDFFHQTDNSVVIKIQEEVIAKFRRNFYTYKSIEYRHKEILKQFYKYIKDNIRLNSDPIRLKDNDSLVFSRILTPTQSFIQRMFDELIKSNDWTIIEKNLLYIAEI